MDAPVTKRKVMQTYQKHIFNTNKLHYNIFPHLYLWNFTKNFYLAQLPY